MAVTGHLVLLQPSRPWPTGCTWWGQLRGQKPPAESTFQVIVCYPRRCGWEGIRMPHTLFKANFSISPLSHFLTLGALVWDPGDVSEWAGVCFCFCHPNRWGGNIPSDGETSLQSACRVQYLPFPFSLTLCHLSLGYVDIVYLSSQANKLWQKEHLFHRSNISKNAMVVIIITVITACSFFFPKSAEQFS